MPETVPAMRRAWLEIDTGALVRNFRRVAGAVAPARVVPVVKADAYGHGAAIVARALEPEGAAAFAVALVEEGIELRRAGISSSVLVLSPTPAGAEGALLEFELVPVVCGLDQLGRIAAAAAAAGRRIPIHLKFDSGMTRLGFAAAETPAVLERVRRESAVEITGVLSHLAEAEAAASPANERQMAAFRELLGALTASERERAVVHLANSAGALTLAASRHDLVRVGLALYGVAPAEAPTGLEPVMSVVSELVQVREVPAGTRAGYGGRWTAGRASRVGVVPVGYADGYPWRAEGRAAALVGGRRAPLAGAVSMDLILLDLTDSGGDVGDRVTLVGRDGADSVAAVELAGHAGTLVYEILCHFGLRLPRRALAAGAGAGARAGREAWAG